MKNNTFKTERKKLKNSIQKSMKIKGKSSIQYPDKWTIGTYVYSYMHVHHHQNDKLFFYINALTNA